MGGANRKRYEGSLSCYQSYAFVSLKIQIINQELLILMPFIFLHFFKLSLNNWVAASIIMLRG